MQVKLSERQIDVAPGTSLHRFRAEHKPEADIVVLNGAVVTDDRPLVEGDELNLIRRGETPSADELEALLVARHTPGVHAAVKNGTVGIAGLGGLGSTVAVALVRTGVGRLVLADFDVVEPSNLNRQQYTVDQIGRYKAEVLPENLRAINPYVTLETHVVKLTADNIVDVFRDVNIMVEAFDSPAAKAMLVQHFRKARPQIPIVTASGLAGYGPGNSIRVRKVLRNLYLVGDEESEARPGTGLMAPRVGIAASHQANAVLRLLLGQEVD